HHARRLPRRGSVSNLLATGLVKARLRRGYNALTCTFSPARVAEPGRRAGLRIRCPKGRGGSTPPSRTLCDLHKRLPAPWYLNSTSEADAHRCSPIPAPPRLAPAQGQKSGAPT